MHITLFTKHLKHLAPVLCLFLLNSCSVNKLLPLGAQTAKDGAALAQKGVDTYTLLGQQNAIDESQQDLAKILTNPNPAKMPMPHTQLTGFSKQLEPRIRAYQCLLRVYQEFALLTDSKYSGDTKTATSALATAYSSVKELPQVSSVVSGLIADGAGALTSAIQGGQIKAQNEALYKLTKIYLELWNDDAVLWNKDLDHIYDTYAAALNSAPNKLFDMSKVKAAVTEPYSDETVLLLIYRVKQRDAIILGKNTIKQLLTDFGKALQLLNETHAELSKDNSNVATVTTDLNNIELLLKTK